jgi:hypothetical protein
MIDELVSDLVEFRCNRRWLLAVRVHPSHQQSLIDCLRRAPVVWLCCPSGCSAHFVTRIRSILDLMSASQSRPDVLATLAVCFYAARWTTRTSCSSTESAASTTPCTRYRSCESRTAFDLLLRYCD